MMTTARMTGYAVDSDALRDYYHNVERETCIITQIESAEAVEAIPAMASVEGVDAMFIGPSDLAASMARAHRATTARCGQGRCWRECSSIAPP